MPRDPNARIVASDPGKWHAGVGFFHRRQLVGVQFPRWPNEFRAESRQGDACAFVAWSVVTPWSTSPDAVVVEQPLIRDPRRQKGAQADLLPLCDMKGAFFARFHPTTCISVPVTMWKGNRPKDITLPHVMAKLSDTEKNIIFKLGLSKEDVEHVIEAVGVGLWAVARM